MSKPGTRTVTYEGLLWTCRTMTSRANTQPAGKCAVHCERDPRLGGSVFTAPINWQDPDVLSDEELRHKIREGLG